jgi:ribose/xylose/arabinose/galactoside ABC-type transport system permease subunit
MSLGRMLIVLGVMLVALGVIVSLGQRLPVRLGRLPGDIVIRGKHSVFYFPIVTSILLSVILSLVLWLFRSR